LTLETGIDGRMKRQRVIVWLVISVMLWVTPAYMLAKICDGYRQTDKNVPNDQISQPTAEAAATELAYLIQK